MLKRVSTEGSRSEREPNLPEHTGRGCCEVFTCEYLEPALELCMKVQRSTGVNGRKAEHKEYAN